MEHLSGDEVYGLDRRKAEERLSDSAHSDRESEIYEHRSIGRLAGARVTYCSECSRKFQDMFGNSHCRECMMRPFGEDDDLRDEIDDDATISFIGPMPATCDEMRRRDLLRLARLGFEGLAMCALQDSSEIQRVTTATREEAAD